MPSKPFQPEDFLPVLPADTREQVAEIANARFHELLAPLRELVGKQKKEREKEFVNCWGEPNASERLEEIYAAIEKVIE